MPTLVGIAGSLRRESFNAALLRAAQELAPDGCTLTIESIGGIPLYDGDLEQAQGVPEPVRRLKDRVASADGLLIVTPEYNHSIPAVLKNAIDWMTRPPKDIARVFGGKPVAVMGATPGSAGTRYAQLAWLPVLHTLGARAWFGKSLFLASAADAFREGGLVDDALRRRLADFMTGFADFVTRAA